ncbi:hypothetical protein FOZ62_010862 [Perkinsus olseni]|uniref:Uncharacterized protein n=1 Tax=Perkinsus olseni TaxID=32597 RepID=A0A7J6R9Z8_PEROL|nr:hypothetical protein FOZ62_010862 [Perkinsus olseni]
MSSSYGSDSAAAGCREMSPDLSAKDPVSGTTSVHARISVPVEDLLKQLTRPSTSSSDSDDGERRIIYVPAERCSRNDGGSGTVLGTTRMPVKARASSLVHVKYNTVSATYEVELNVDIDLPTTDVSYQILEHVRPLAGVSAVGEQRTRREGFSDVPMAFIRELGHGGSSVWQAYKACNKWHKNKHHALYFLSKQKALSSSDFDALGGSGGLNADAPEFKPDTRGRHLSPPPPRCGDFAGYGKMPGLASGLSRCPDASVPHAEAAYASPTMGADFGSISTTATESGYSSTFVASPVQLPVDMTAAGEDRFDSWRTSKRSSAPRAITAARSHSSSFTSGGFNSSHVSSPATPSSSRFNID